MALNQLPSDHPFIPTIDDFLANKHIDKSYTLENRNRYMRGSRAKLQIIAVSHNLNETSIGKLSNGEYIEFHYFPSETTETFSPQYDNETAGTTKISPDLEWKGAGPRTLKFKMFFNEFGDNIGQIAQATTPRKGMLSVSESLQFLREIVSPVVSLSGEGFKTRRPVLVGVFGLHDREFFVGVITGLSINVTHWSPKQFSVTLDDPQNKQGNIGPSHYLSSDLKTRGYGKAPIRATADIDITQSFWKFKNESAQKTN